MKWKATIAVVLLIPLLVVVAFAVMSATARRPKTLGTRDGRLAPCPDSPNCVSTQAERDSQRIEPLRFADEDPADAMSRLREAILSMPRARIITQEDNYLHVEFTSALFRFVDDVEFVMDHQQRIIHFRSASRVGHSDLGLNRQRMNAIVTAFGHQQSPDHFGSPKTDR